jgi:glutathione S-transferase
MRTLYHMWLSPYSRKVRLAMGEKKLPFELHFERAWERRPEYLALNPSGKVPTLVEEDGRVIADSYAICEYLEEIYPDPALLGTGPTERAETRRLVGWFDTKFHPEVTDKLVTEKVFKKFLKTGEPSSEAIRGACESIHAHLEYIGKLAYERNWLAGENVSLADLAAGANLSCVDYLGDVPWGKHPRAKDWYARLKSRPSFRPLLSDFIPGLAPPRHYADPDF